MDQQPDAAILIAELKRQLAEFRNIFDTMPIMFWYKDKENRHVRVNRAAADLEGVSVQSMEGISAYDLYPREIAESYHRDDLEVVQSGRPKLGIIEKHQQPGSSKVTWLQTGKVPYFDADGQIVGVIAFAVDITRQVMAEQSVRQMRDVLQQQYQLVDRANKLLLSTLHELTKRLMAGDSQPDLIAYIEHVLAELNEMK